MPRNLNSYDVREPKEGECRFRKGCILFTNSDDYYDLKVGKGYEVLAVKVSEVTDAQFVLLRDESELFWYNVNTEAGFQDFTCQPPLSEPIGELDRYKMQLGGLYHDKRQLATEITQLELNLQTLKSRHEQVLEKIEDTMTILGELDND